MFYWIVKHIAQIVVRSFFREVTVFNKERIPLYGPVIFVGNHNNQFVDASMLIACIPRQIRFLIAEKSLSRPLIGRFAKAIGSIGVARRQDKAYNGLGLVYWERGSKKICGIGSNFQLDVHKGDKLVVPNAQIAVTIASVISSTEIIVQEELPEMRKQVFSTQNSSEKRNLREKDTDESHFEHGYPFSVLPRVNQSDVYQEVSKSLINSESIAIFPEGGSHDQLALLPLKPGVAIMTLAAAAEGAQDVMIVPLGITYYQADKILSRAFIQVGYPISITDEMVAAYQQNRREATSNLLKTVEEALRSCRVFCGDYNLVKIVRICVTLYPPEHQYLSSDQYHTLYQVFSKLLSKYTKHDRVSHFIHDVQDYASLLKSYGIADHEVQILKQNTNAVIYHIVHLLWDILFSFILGAIPSLLWGPIGMASSYFAEQHRKKALAQSKIKIKGTDVVASYKILTLMVLVPAANLIYSLIFGFFFSSSFKQTLLICLLGLCLLPLTYYHSIRQFRNLRALLRRFRFHFLVLVSKLNEWRDTEKKIITKRMQMQLSVRELVNDMVNETEEQYNIEIEKCVPEILCKADSKRIKTRLGDFIPLYSTMSLIDGREEIL